MFERIAGKRCSVFGNRPRSCRTNRPFVKQFVPLVLGRIPQLLRRLASATVSPMATALQARYLALLADDSEDDALLLELAFQRLEQFRLVRGAMDGRQTIAYLRGEGEFSDRNKHPFPHLLLLDLRMPRGDGFDVLKWLRGQSFSQLLVAVLSGSAYEADRRKALRMGAHYYLTKPLRFDEQVEILRQLEATILKRPDVSAPMPAQGQISCGF
jgi:Response regulators consisting of a CheY-like receiver domain and a winged-helix DNA-binding domain